MKAILVVCTFLTCVGSRALLANSRHKGLATPDGNESEVQDHPVISHQIKEDSVSVPRQGAAERFAVFTLSKKKLDRENMNLLEENANDTVDRTAGKYQEGVRRQGLMESEVGTPTGSPTINLTKQINATVELFDDVSLASGAEQTETQVGYQGRVASPPAGWSGISAPDRDEQAPHDISPAKTAPQTSYASIVTIVVIILAPITVAGYLVIRNFNCSLAFAPTAPPRELVMGNPEHLEARGGECELVTNWSQQNLLSCSDDIKPEEDIQDMDNKVDCLGLVGYWIAKIFFSIC